MFEKHISNRFADSFGKSKLFPDFQYGFKSSNSVENLLAIVFDKIARIFNISEVTRVATLVISKAFEGLGMSFFFTNSSLVEFQIEISDVFLHFSVIDGFGWFLVGVSQGFIIVLIVSLINI